MNRLTAFLLIPLASCASTSSNPSFRTEPVPQEEARVQALRDAEARRQRFDSVMVRLDQAMESYAVALANQGIQRADKKAKQLERMIRETVLDEGTARSGNVAFGSPPGNNFARLQALAIDGSQPHYQAIALAALGFSGRFSVMPTILQGAQSDDPLLIDRAVFGLAILQAPGTPPGLLASIVENDKLSEASRAQAAWALYRLQPVSRRKEEIVSIWKRYCGPDRDEIPPMALVQAVRGLGLTRDEAHAESIAPLLESPWPLVRMAAADALARVNAQSHVEDLIELLKPAETVANVRLHARKALQALAGGVDRGYDLKAWLKVFERK